MDHAAWSMPAPQDQGRTPGPSLHPRTKPAHGRREGPHPAYPRIRLRKGERASTKPLLVCARGLVPSCVTPSPIVKPQPNPRWVTYPSMHHRPLPNHPITQPGSPQTCVHPWPPLPGFVRDIPPDPGEARPHPISRPAPSLLLLIPYPPSLLLIPYPPSLLRNVAENGRWREQLPWSRVGPGRGESLFRERRGKPESLRGQPCAPEAWASGRLGSQEG